MLVDKNKSISLYWDVNFFFSFKWSRIFFIILSPTWQQTKIKAVPCKVSSCGVCEVSRQGIEWLGNSFGCMKVAMKVVWGLAHNRKRKSNHQQHPSNIFVLGDHFVNVGKKKASWAWSADNDVTWNAIMKREFCSLSSF